MKRGFIQQFNVFASCDETAVGTATTWHVTLDIDIIESDEEIKDEVKNEVKIRR